MKIIGISKAKSKAGAIVFVTEPPLTFTVFNTFRELWNASDFSFLNGSLVWAGPAHIDAEFRRQTEIYLTEAENALKAEKNRAQGSENNLLQKVSERTGLPLL
jgi:hypothetical protein